MTFAEKANDGIRDEKGTQIDKKDPWMYNFNYEVKTKTRSNFVVGQICHKKLQI